MKKVFSLFLTILMCLTISLGAFAEDDFVFTDVKDDSPYKDAIIWAVKEGITNGTSKTTFSPDETCTIAQILTFLWRNAGSPDSTFQSPASDIGYDSPYFKALCWSYEKDIFEPEYGASPCTREVAVTYLWKLAGRPVAKTQCPFTDVESGTDGEKAVLWAVKEGITNGTSETTFSPDATCTRGQIVTFLYRHLN